MADARAAKVELRRAARRLAAHGPGADAALLRLLLEMGEWDRSGTVALFAALPGEPAVHAAGPRLRARGWRTAYPRIDGEALQFHVVDDEAALTVGAGPLREPPADAPQVDPSEVALWLVPGLLFARDGVRLGRGGGHYDRVLGRASDGALRIGICYADRVRDTLPTEPHDRRVNAIATESGVVRIAIAPTGSRRVP